MRSGKTIKWGIFLAWAVNSAIVGLVLYCNVSNDYGSRAESWLMITSITGVVAFLYVEFWAKREQVCVLNRSAQE